MHLRFVEVLVLEGAVLQLGHSHLYLRVEVRLFVMVKNAHLLPEASPQMVKRRVREAHLHVLMLMSESIQNDGWVFNATHGKRNM